MPKRFSFLRRRYAWALTVGCALAIFSGYTLLDAFVFPKAYAPAQQAAPSEATYTHIAQATARAAAEPETTPPPSALSAQSAAPRVTDNSYQDAHIRLQIDTVEENGTVYYVADIQLADARYLKTALAEDTFGKNITQTTSDMARQHHALFAINGDYYGFRDSGLVIRNGVLYRESARSGASGQALVIDAEGNLAVVQEGEISGDALLQQGILQGFSFGPALVVDGQIAQGVDDSGAATAGRRKGGAGNTAGAQPRTAIGQISPLHYVIIVVDGRSEESSGMTLAQLAQRFQDRGCTLAYNLDGGGSSAMWFNGQLINHPTDGRKAGERKISDIIYIGEASA